MEAERVTEEVNNTAVLATFAVHCADNYYMRLNCSRCNILYLSAEEET